MFLIIYSLLSLIFTLKLLVYHTLLILNNLTTKEEINRKKSVYLGNPYKMLSLAQNLSQALCPKISKDSFLSMKEMKTNDPV